MAAYRAAVAAKRHRLFLGLAILGIALGLAGVVGEVDLVKFYANIHRLPNYIWNITPPLSWATLGADIAEWFWNLKDWLRLLVDTLKQVVVVPTGAVQRGPNGTFVYVVKDDDTVSVRPMTVQKQDETQTVISKGLEAPERVVTTGFVRLTDGTKVAIGSGEAPAAQPAG